MADVEETGKIEFFPSRPYRVNRAIVISVQWQNIPWWKRLGAVFALPYQVCRFVTTGRGDFLMVKNVWSK